MDKKFPVCVVRFRPAGRSPSCAFIASRFSARTSTSTPTSFRRKAIAFWSAPRRWKPKCVRSWPTGQGGNKAAATLVGKRVAEKAKAAGIELVAFDRSGFRYHGRVKALADAAREAGLKF